MRRKPLIRLHVKFSVFFIYYYDFFFSVLGTLVLVLLIVDPGQLLPTPRKKALMLAKRNSHRTNK